MSSERDIQESVLQPFVNHFIFFSGSASNIRMCKLKAVLRTNKFCELRSTKSKILQ